jgi:hypothetical protein
MLLVQSYTVDRLREHEAGSLADGEETKRSNHKSKQLYYMRINLYKSASYARNISQVTENKQGYQGVKSGGLSVIRDVAAHEQPRPEVTPRPR